MRVERGRRRSLVSAASKEHPRQNERSPHPWRAMQRRLPPSNRRHRCHAFEMLRDGAPIRSGPTQRLSPLRPVSRTRSQTLAALRVRRGSGPLGDHACRVRLVLFLGSSRSRAAMAGPERHERRSDRLALARHGDRRRDQLTTRRLPPIQAEDAAHHAVRSSSALLNYSDHLERRSATGSR